MERGEIQRRRKHPAFAGLVMRGASGPAQIAATGKHNEQLKVFRICRKFTPLRKLEPFSGEVLARAKQSRLLPLRAQAKRRNFALVSPAELNDFERFLNVQLTRLAVSVEAIVVIHAIGDVGILLDL